MDDFEPPTCRPATPYGCPSCSRCFVAVGELDARQLVCICGTPLSPRSLPSGLHELRSRAPDADSAVRDVRSRAPDADSAVRDVRSHAPDADSAVRERTPIPLEHDVGYGASHGNNATHGGPSGPGDAPANVTERAPAGHP